MRARCRKAFVNMLEWYRDKHSLQDSPQNFKDTVQELPRAVSDGGSLVEIILILVTHAALCNTLIEDLAGSALWYGTRAGHDVPIASLTLAYRQQPSEDTRQKALTLTQLNYRQLSSSQLDKTDSLPERPMETTLASTTLQVGA